jgi:hypothetical protein
MSSGNNSARLRLVKVVVQATFVLDDGDSLTEQLAAPVTVSAAEWPTYASETFPKQVAELEQQMNAGEPAPGGEAS